MQDRKQIARLMRDLDEIKAAVKRNNPLLRELVTSRFYWWLIVLFGFVIAAFALGLAWLVGRYGTYGAIPASVRTAFWIVAAGAGVATYTFRVVGVVRTIRRIDPRLTIWSLFWDHNLGEFFHIMGPVFLMAVGATVFLARLGQPFFIVGAWGLALGVTWNLVGFAVHLVELYVMGYWYIAAGALSFFIPGVSAGVWTAVCVGGGSLAYVAAAAVVRKMYRVKGSGDG